MFTDLHCIIPFCYWKTTSQILDNHYRGVENLHQQGVGVTVIEAGYHNQFHLQTNPYTIQLNTNSIIWQKERLINYGASIAPATAKYIVWIDSGVLLPNNWMTDTIEKFNNGIDIVQPFWNTRWEESPSLTPMFPSGDLARSVCGGGSILGLAWAAKKELFDDIGLWDRGIVGGGDCMFHAAAANIEPHPLLSIYTTQLHYQNWRKKLIQSNLNKLACLLTGTAVHLWHGPMLSRHYATRYEVLEQFNYDANNDVGIIDNVLEFVGNNPIRFGIRKYFSSRLRGHNL